MQHMLPMGAAPAQRHPSVLAGIAESGVGIFIQTICPLLLAAGLFTRIVALALLVQVLVFHSPGHMLTAPYAAALLGWLAVLGPGALSLDDALQLGMSATALPFVGAIRKALASVTHRFGPVYNLLLRLWIAAALGLIALGQIHVLDPALSIQMGRNWLPRMAPMGAEVGPWFLLAVAVSFALGLLTRVSALLLVAVIPASQITPAGDGQLNWLVLLNLPLLGLPLFYGAGSLSVDHAILAWLRTVFPPFEALSPEAAAMLPHVLIVGGGFGGVAATRGLRYAPCRITLIDRRNYHLFQPLLYQVATAGLSAADIATPLREILRDQPNVRVLLGEVHGVDVDARQVTVGAKRLGYDFLILATGAQHSYFGRDDWIPFAPGLKGIDDALAIRRRVLIAFEEAEDSTDEDARRAWLTFIVVGGGPTGVELSGAIAELARHSFRREFRTIDPASARILLVQSADRVLPFFPECLSTAAVRSLGALGVEVRTRCRVGAVDARGADVGGEWVAARTVLWAAGVAASPAAEWLGAVADRAGRVQVEPDLTVPGQRQVFVIGDTAASPAWRGGLVPGLAPAAKQGGAYAARAIRAALLGRPPPPPFRYKHYGSLATVGRQAAMAEFGRIRVSGALAWWLWGAAHVAFLVSTRNRAAVMINWLWAYLSSDAARA